MKEALKIYFGRAEIIFYWLLALVSLTYIITTGSLLKYWYLSFIIILLSPFIEYFSHQYFLHFPMPKNREKFKFLFNFLDNIHYIHHRDPKNVDYIFAQAWLTLPVLVMDVSIAYLITGSLEMTLVIITFMMFYYLLYEWTHFLAHSNYNPKNRYSSYMKKYHLLHHYKNENYWYGITNPLGDIIFGKYKNPDTVEKSPTVKSLANNVFEI
jgi:4-hydroxysphinganine ceramide fatty acyl 2-hydroxylase